MWKYFRNRDLPAEVAWSVPNGSPIVFDGLPEVTRPYLAALGPSNVRLGYISSREQVSQFVYECDGRYVFYFLDPVYVIEPKQFELKRAEAEDRDGRAQLIPSFVRYSRGLNDDEIDAFFDIATHNERYVFGMRHVAEIAHGQNSACQFLSGQFKKQLPGDLTNGQCHEFGGR
jgi:hypothetical protein